MKRVGGDFAGIRNEIFGNFYLSVDCIFIFEFSCLSLMIRGMLVN